MVSLLSDLPKTFLVWTRVNKFTGVIDSIPFLLSNLKKEIKTPYQCMFFHLLNILLYMRMHTIQEYCYTPHWRHSYGRWKNTRRYLGKCSEAWRKYKRFYICLMVVQRNFDQLFSNYWIRLPYSYPLPHPLETCIIFHIIQSRIKHFFY